MWTLIKGHHFSIVLSALAGVVICGLFFFAAERWSPLDQNQVMSAFAVLYVLLTYLVLQMVAHIFFGPASKKQMLVDMLSSLLPVAIILYVLAEYLRGDLILSLFQLHTALLTGYALILDLLVDVGLTLWPRRFGVPEAVA